jgi:hypothetical protein
VRSVKGSGERAPPELRTSLELRSPSLSTSRSSCERRSHGVNALLATLARSSHEEDPFWNGAGGFGRGSGSECSGIPFVGSGSTSGGRFSIIILFCESRFLFRKRRNSEQTIRMTVKPITLLRMAARWLGECAEEFVLGVMVNDGPVAGESPWVGTVIKVLVITVPLCVYVVVRGSAVADVAPSV